MNENLSPGTIKTMAFKESLQAMFAARGIKVSKQSAWELFKDTIGTTVNFVVEDEDQKLTLSGVGSFRIHRSRPRGGKANALKWIPRFRFVPSSRIQDELLDRLDCWKSGKGREDIIVGPPVGVPATEDPISVPGDPDTHTAESVSGKPPTEPEPSVPNPEPNQEPAVVPVDPDEFNFEG